MRFIAFDTETTGFLPGVDNIVELGAVLFVNGEPEAKFSTLVNPFRPIPPAASKVSGITDEMVKDSPSIEDLLVPFAEFCGDDIIVAHNAPFDFEFLKADILKYESPAPKGLVLDTCAMARKVIPGLANYKLGTLVQHLNIPSSNFHRAEEDAIYCGKLFLHLVKKISPTGQLPAIENLIQLSNNQKLNFPQVERQAKQLGLF